MLTWGSVLEKHCKNIESVIAVEKQKLKSAQEQLKQHETNGYACFEKEREESKKRHDQIRRLNNQVLSLRSEYDNLRKAIINAENRNVGESVFKRKKKSLKAVAAEIESCRMEVDKVDRKLREIREGNASIEKEYKKRLRDFNGKHGFIIKPRSSGCLQLGRLMVEQEDAKHALNSITEKKTRLVAVVRELERNLTVAEKQCVLQEKSIRKRESEELERSMALLESAHKREKEFNAQLERCLATARSRLAFLKTMAQPEECLDIENLRKEIEENKKLAESYKVNIDELNLVASTLHDDVLEVARRKSQQAKNFMKNYEEAMRKVNADVHKMKSENSQLDEKIENIHKLHDWAKLNHEIRIMEHDETEPTGEERLLTRFRVEEGEARNNLLILKESSKKVKEQIESLLDVLFNSQLQCFTKERMIEETSSTMREVLTENEVGIGKKSR